MNSQVNYKPSFSLGNAELINLQQIHDKCRENLNKSTIKAYSLLLLPENPSILDIGCGTGVPTIALQNLSGSKVYAIDYDSVSLAFFEYKLQQKKIENNIKLIRREITDELDLGINFDLVWAEGLLNVIGFENGLRIAKKLLKSGGYFVIHDEFKDDEVKQSQIKQKNFRLLHSFRLNEDVWGNDYYAYIAHEFERIPPPTSKSARQFYDIINQELNIYRKNPEIFRSIFYILKILD